MLSGNQAGEGMSLEEQSNRGPGDDMNRRMPRWNQLTPTNQPKSSWIEGAGITGPEQAELTWTGDTKDRRRETRASARTIPRWAWIIMGLVVLGLLLRSCV